MEQSGDSVTSAETEPKVLQSAIALTHEVHEGITGLDGRPLVEHCMRIMDDPSMKAETSKETIELQLVALLHDASNPQYATIPSEELYDRMRAIDCSEKVIDAVKCFVRPPNDAWDYDDWITFLNRNELTRRVKIADSRDAIAHFPPQSENQGAAWKRTLDRLLNPTTETPEVTARINASLQKYPLPQLAEV